MYVLAVILCRAGSKGLPNKCVLPLHGQPVITYTFDHVRDSALLNDAVLTTNAAEAAAIAVDYGIEVVERPAALATDDATVDSAARHCVDSYEDRHGLKVDAVVLLYANVPVRRDGVIDRAVHHLLETGADSVRTVAPVGKRHPLWLHRLDGDRMVKYAENDIYRRQDLAPLYYHDGAVVVVRREALFTPPRHDEDFHAFFGQDRRAFVQGPFDAVDIDELHDLELAEVLLRRTRNADGEGDPQIAETRARRPTVPAPS